MRLWFLPLTLLGLLGLALWLQGRPIPRPPGVLAPEAPRQTPLAPSDPRSLSKGDFHLQPVAAFQVEARVLSRKRYPFDRGAPLAPLDLALGWGPMSDSGVLARLRIWQGGRAYFYAWWGEPPIPPEAIVRNSANMHLIPATPLQERILRRVRPGHLVRLRGYLVNAFGPEGFAWYTSTTREDTGDGACELVWVEAVFLR